MRQLAWSSGARADLDSIAEYHAGNDRRVGEALIARIEEAADKLARFDTGRPGRIAGTREKSVSKTSYIIVYEVHDDLVLLFRIVHTARNWP